MSKKIERSLNNVEKELNRIGVQLSSMRSLLSVICIAANPAIKRNTADSNTIENSTTVVAYSLEELAESIDKVSQELYQIARN